MRMEYIVVAIVLAMIVLLVALSFLSGVPPTIDNIFQRLGGG